VSAALRGGVFTGPTDDLSDLRALVDEIGERSFDARIGRRSLPDGVDHDAWRHLQDAGLTRLASTPDSGGGATEVALILRSLARHAVTVPLAETDVLACWLAGEAGLAVPETGLVTLALGEVSPAGELSAVPYAAAADAVVLALRDGDLLRVAAETGHDLSSLRLVGGGGAPRPPEQVRRISTSFARAAPNNGWGMTETNAIGAGITGPEYLDRPDTSGRAAPVLDLRVVGDDGEPLTPGEAGELQVCGSSVFVGYWNRPEDTEASFDGPWFRTGDVARIDDEGFVTIVDRIKDLIIRGGENIGCGQVEAALSTHPLVREVAVYAVPDERLGEEVGATVYGPAGLDPEELQEYLVGRIAPFAIPQYVTVTMVPLPRTATGKIFKRRIREEAIAEYRAAGILP